MERDLAHLLEDADPDVINMKTTMKGRTVDLNNMPGTLKLNMIKTGELDADQFVTPPNCPGKKLKALREAHRKRVDSTLKRTNTGKNEFQVGDMVKYDDLVYEVMKIHEDRGVLIHKEVQPGHIKKIWVHHTKVEKG